MSNSTDNLEIRGYGLGGRKVFMPVKAAAKIYSGILVAQDTATGGLVAGSTSGSSTAVGVSEHFVDNTTGALGDVRCIVRTDQTFLFANAGSTDACSEAMQLGAPVYMTDDHTVQNNSASSTLQRAGYFAGMEPDGRVRVFVSAFAAVGATVAAVAPLVTTAAAGAAGDNTFEAMPDAGSAPATATILRDDIVTNILPKVRNNFQDVGAKVNAIITALKSAGIMN